MSTAALFETATVRDLLFGGVPGDPSAALAKSMHDHHTVDARVARFPGMTPGLGKAVERKVAAAVVDLLSLDLRDLAVAGWNRYEELRKAALRTRNSPNAQELVKLLTHRIESNHQPNVELLIDGMPAATIRVDLNVAFDMAGAIAVVRQARLVEIQVGNCTVIGTLAIEGAVVAKRKRQFNLPGGIRLHHGMALLGA